VIVAILSLLLESEKSPYSFYGLIFRCFCGIELVKSILTNISACNEIFIQRKEGT
jgi:hypothetical protein